MLAGSKSKCLYKFINTMKNKSCSCWSMENFPLSCCFQFSRKQITTATITQARLVLNKNSVRKLKKPSICTFI